MAERLARTSQMDATASLDFRVVWHTLTVMGLSHVVAISCCSQQRSVCSTVKGKVVPYPPPMTALANTQSGNLKVKGHFGVNLPQEEHKKMMTVPDSGGYWCIDLNGKT